MTYSLLLRQAVNESDLPKIRGVLNEHGSKIFSSDKGKSFLTAAENLFFKGVELLMQQGDIPPAYVNLVLLSLIRFPYTPNTTIVSILQNGGNHISPWVKYKLTTWANAKPRQPILHIVSKLDPAPLSQSDFVFCTAVEKRSFREIETLLRTGQISLHAKEISLLVAVIQNRFLTTDHLLSIGEEISPEYQEAAFYFARFSHLKQVLESFNNYYKYMEISYLKRIRTKAYLTVLGTGFCVPDALMNIILQYAPPPYIPPERSIFVSKSISQAIQQGIKIVRNSGKQQKKDFSATEKTKKSLTFRKEIDSVSEVQKKLTRLNLDAYFSKKIQGRL